MMVHASVRLSVRPNITLRGKQAFLKRAQNKSFPTAAVACLTCVEDVKLIFEETYLLLTENVVHGDRKV